MQFRLGADFAVTANKVTVYRGCRNSVQLWCFLAVNVEIGISQGARRWPCFIPARKTTTVHHGFKMGDEIRQRHDEEIVTFHYCDALFSVGVAPLVAR